ncbi:hypothetical protein M3Y97_00324300 [Aphelenchoides bicaudatus]|nr:hypothetical protein M3Y97_00324300 [Aphelenchoides bicaudatus]
MEPQIQQQVILTKHVEMEEQRLKSPQQNEHVGRQEVFYKFQGAQTPTYFRWEIKKIRSLHYNLHPKYIESLPFMFGNDPTKRFALYFDSKNFWARSFDRFGLVLKETNGDQLKVKLKFWLEKPSGRKFGRRHVNIHMFQKAGDKHSFGFGTKLDEAIPLLKALVRNSNIFFCCKITPYIPQINN